MASGVVNVLPHQIDICDPVRLKGLSSLARTVAPRENEFDACLHLRHDYFVKHRGWVTCNGSGEETDHYDPFCQHLAVFHNDHILAYMRLLPWQPTTDFMLEHDFACLLTDEERASIIHENSAELSRLVIAPDAHNKSLSAAPVLGLAITPATQNDTCVNSENHMISGNSFGRLAALYPLFKVFFHTARQQNIQTFYIVMEPPMLKILQRKFGIPFVPLGKPYTFPDGTVAQAAFTTLAETERSITARFPQRYAWYQQSP